jgi:hypothetical protein
VRHDANSKDLKAVAGPSSKLRAGFRSAALLTLIIVALGVLIASVSRGRDPFLIAAGICGVMIVTCWAVTLSFAVLVLTLHPLRERLRRVSQENRRVPDVRGGVADHWLDGPF